MTEPQRVADVAAHAPLHVENAAEELKSGGQRLQVFKAIYVGQKPKKSVEELMDITGITKRSRILTLIKQLADSGFTEKKREYDSKSKKHITYCYKFKNIARYRDKILSAAENTEKLQKIKQNNRGFTVSTKTVVVKVPATLAKAHFLTVDDLDSFAKVKNVEVGKETKIDMLEDTFEEGIREILEESWKQMDWGGENDDMYSTRVKYKGKRIPTAFAFKGRGTKPPLTVGKLNKGQKGADQIQRLFEAPAELYILQFQGSVTEHVIKYMEHESIVKSLEKNKTIYYMIINGQDSARLVKAYPKAFKE